MHQMTRNNIIKDMVAGDKESDIAHRYRHLGVTPRIVTEIWKQHNVYADKQQRVQNQFDRAHGHKYKKEKL